MPNAITVINTGSSSIKFSVFGEYGAGLRRVLAGSIKDLGASARHLASARVREGVCRDAGWLGVALDEAAHRAGAGRISAAGSTVEAWVIAEHTRRTIADVRVGSDT